ncbi:hypothetical protein L596_015994 [Steinernema carpocapsae]|nr:hypothetical protein L596_015994 [Steinernema carpocapsae]
MFLPLGLGCLCLFCWVVPLLRVLSYFRACRQQRSVDMNTNLPRDVRQALARRCVGLLSKVFQRASKRGRFVRPDDAAIVLGVARDELEATYLRTKGYGMKLDQDEDEDIESLLLSRMVKARDRPPWMSERTSHRRSEKSGRT